MKVDTITEEFAEALSDGSNESTVERYTGQVRAWAEWCEDRDIGPCEASIDQIEDHAEDMHRKGYADLSIKTRLAAIVKLYELRADKDISADIKDRGLWKKYRSSKKKAELRDRDAFVSQEDFEDMLDNVPSPARRNRILLRVLRYCGPRVGELCELRGRDVIDSEQELRIRTEKTQDDDDSRAIPLSDGLLTLLKEWRDRYRQTMGGYDPDTDWLFPTMKASQISIQQVNEIVKKAAEGAGIQNELYTDMSGQTRYEVTAHSLRYSAARGLQDQDVKTRDISTFLGHRRIRTTEGYLGAREKDMQDAVRRSWEEDGG